MTSWMDLYKINYHHNIPFSSLRRYGALFDQLKFTEAELGVKFVYENGVFSHLERPELAKIGTQLNLEPVPGGLKSGVFPAKGILPAAGTPSRGARRPAAGAHGRDRGCARLGAAAGDRPSGAAGCAA